VNSRAVCVNPPGLPGTTANREGAGGMGNVYPEPGAFLYPPHTLATVAGALRNGGLEVVARDGVLEGDSVDRAVAWVAGQMPTWLIVQVSWATREADVAFLRAARAALPHTPIVAIGASVAWMEDARRAVPDVAWLVGEPERTLGLFLALFGTDLERWRGALSAAMLGKPGAPTQQAQPLENLPRPAWDLFRWQGYGMLTVVGSKGCDHACAYCPYIVAQGNRFRPRPVDEVVDEMAYLAREFRPARVVFRDPVFARERERVLALCEGLARRKVRLAWECESRADDLDAELVQAMARAGCAAVKLGLESADTAVLVAARRVRDAASAEVYRGRALAAAAACARQDVALRVFLLTGLPQESDAAIAETARFVAEMRPSALHVKVVDRYPGTSMDWAVTAEDAQRRAEVLRASWTPPSAQARRGLWARVIGRLAR